MNKAVVIDLDGTLLACNSFVEYVKFVLPRHPLVLIDVMARKLRVISHARAKQRILCRTRLSATEIDRFVDRLIKKYLREEILDRFKDRTVVLASAAPAVYVHPLARRLGIAYSIGTEIDGGETRGEYKRTRVIGLLDDLGMELDAVVTDHADDIPLLLSNRGGTNYLVCPGAKSVAEIRAAGIKFVEIDRPVSVS